MFVWDSEWKSRGRKKKRSAWPVCPSWLGPKRLPAAAFKVSLCVLWSRITKPLTHIQWSSVWKVLSAALLHIHIRFARMHQHKGSSWARTSSVTTAGVRDPFDCGLHCHLLPSGRSCLSVRPSYLMHVSPLLTQRFLVCPVLLGPSFSDCPINDTRKTWKKGPQKATPITTGGLETGLRSPLQIGWVDCIEKVDNYRWIDGNKKKIQKCCYSLPVLRRGKSSFESYVPNIGWVYADSAVWGGELWSRELCWVFLQNRQQQDRTAACQWKRLPRSPS